MSAATARRLALAVIALAVLLGVGVTYQRYQGRILSATITRPAPELGGMAEVLLPNLRDERVWVPNRPHDPEETRAADRFTRITRLRSFLVSTNSRGLRGPEVADPKKGRRVLCLGDSVTFGWGVPYEESYPARLAAALGAEVVNAGVPAMKPHSMAAWAEKEALGLSPDLVIFTRRPDWSMPEAIYSYKASVRLVQRSIGGARLVLVLPPVSTFDVMGSQVYAQEAADLRAALPDLPLLDLTEAFRDALPLPGVILEVSAGRQRVLRLPEREVLVDVASPERGLAPEVVALFEGDDRIAEPLFYDGGHPDTAGFVLFADTLAAWLRAQGLAP
jgi:lysophospholipase L1-like esterase